MRLSFRSGIGRLAFVLGPALVLTLGLGACSSKKKEDFDSALEAVKAKTRNSLDQWAAAVGKTLGDQLRTSGDIKQSEAAEALTDETDRFADELCGVIAKDGRSLGSEENSAKASDAFRTYVVDAVVGSIGSDLHQLNELKVQLPAFTLSDPAMNPPFGVDPSTLTPGYLGPYIRQEFLHQSGGVQFPREGTPQYDEFVRWTRSDNNALGARAAYFSSPLIRQTDDCLLATRKK